MKTELSAPQHAHVAWGTRDHQALKNRAGSHTRSGGKLEIRRIKDPKVKSGPTDE